MKLSYLKVLAGAALSLALPAAAQANVVLMDAYTSIGPSQSSPSLNNYLANAGFGILLGGIPVGSPDPFPGNFAVERTVSSNRLVECVGFTCWNGQANPGAVFGPEFANEHGNAAYWGLSAIGAGRQIRLSDIGFEMTADYRTSLLTFRLEPGQLAVYSNAFVGFLNGPDGIPYTADDIRITSGPGDLAVDRIIGGGISIAFVANCPGCSLEDQQMDLDAVNRFYNQVTNIRGRYFTVDGFSADATLTVVPHLAAIPEPATWAMMIGGFGLVGGAMRARQRRQLPVALA